MLDKPISPGFRSDRLAATMMPVSFDGCFGWLHVPSVGAGAELAVLICTGFCDEALTAHRQFRLLGEDLASAGYPVLRFDYPGTGDSYDLPDDADLWPVWLDSVHNAMDWLRSITGARQVVLCGLGFGATLAAFAAGQRDDVAALILLEPNVRGRSFIRRMEIEAKLSGARSLDAPSPDAGLEVHGLTLSPASMRTISAIELGQVALAPGSRVAVFSEPGSPALDRVLLDLSDRGARVLKTGFAGLTQFLRPSYMSHEPAAEVSRITRSLLEILPPMPGRPVVLPDMETMQRVDCAETPIRFGVSPDLFGIVCRPLQACSDRVVIIVNSGGDPHYGFARHGVDIARQLARAGISSLRMDFAGLGDSVAPNDDETHIFETDRRADLSAAIDALSSQGFRRFAVFGLCSGAYHAFHAGCADERIDALVLVNLPIFAWRKGDKVEDLSFIWVAPQDAVGKLRKFDNWRRLLSGKVDVASRLAWQGRRWGYKAKAALGRWAGTLGFKPALSAVQAATLALSHRTRTLLIMAPGETGLALLAAEFGSHRSPPGMILKILPEIDHTLTRRAMRRTVSALILDFLGA